MPLRHELYSFDVQQGVLTVSVLLATHSNTTSSSFLCVQTFGNIVMQPKAHGTAAVSNKGGAGVYDGCIYKRERCKALVRAAYAT